MWDLKRRLCVIIPNLEEIHTKREAINMTAATKNQDLWPGSGPIMGFCCAAGVLRLVWVDSGRG